jgi:ferredoxin-type protein NapF
VKPASEINGTQRRLFVTGKCEAIQRPPWTTELRVKESCTSCGNCIEVCPEAILVKGPANTPTLDFALGACTFCQKCVEACDEDVFADNATPPWDLKASIKGNCMLSHGISCQICSDACLDEALTFDLSHLPSGRMDIKIDACTGCGACASVCPVDAIDLQTQRATHV